MKIIVERPHNYSPKVRNNNNNTALPRASRLFKFVYYYYYLNFLPRHRVEIRIKPIRSETSRRTIAQYEFRHYSQLNHQRPVIMPCVRICFVRGKLSDDSVTFRASFRARKKIRSFLKSVFLYIYIYKCIHA